MSVNNIKYIERPSMQNFGMIRILFQPSVDINAALPEFTAPSQTALKQMQAGITPTMILSFHAASAPVLQRVTLSSGVTKAILCMGVATANSMLVIVLGRERMSHERPAASAIE